MSHQAYITSEVFDRLYSDYKQKYIMIAKSYVHDGHIAEDLVTDSFVYYWENRDRLLLENSPQAYILGIVKKKCLMYLRDLKIHHKAQQTIYKFAQWEIQQDIAVLEDCELTKKLFTSEVAAIFQSRIMSLPEITRKVYLSNRDDNLTYHEIAMKYNLSQRQVNREMQRALSSLRVALKDYLPMLLIAASLLKDQH